MTAAIVFIIIVVSALVWGCLNVSCEEDERERKRWGE